MKLFLILVVLSAMMVHGLTPSNRHLVVVCHGLFGSALDLEYIAVNLEKKGYIVLRPKKNEMFATRKGIRALVPDIAHEVLAVKQKNPQLQKISLVGNSLGGLLARNLAAHMFDSNSNKIAGLEPQFLLVSTKETTVVTSLSRFLFSSLDNCVTSFGCIALYHI
jgi:esterase/lipase